MAGENQKTFQVILKSEGYTAKDGAVGIPYHPMWLSPEEGATLIKSGYASPSENGQEIATVEPSLTEENKLLLRHEITMPPITVEDVVRLRNERIAKEEKELPKEEKQRRQTLRKEAEDKGEAPPPLSDVKPIHEMSSQEVQNAVTAVVSYVPHVLDQTITIDPNNASAALKTSPKGEAVSSVTMPLTTESAPVSYEGAARKGDDRSAEAIRQGEDPKKMINEEPPKPPHEEEHKEK